MRFWTSFAAVAFLTIATASAQTHQFGPAVGAVLPAMSAPDQTGAERSISTLGGERGLVLLVARAADWCPYCQQQMIGLEGIRAQVEQRGWKIATISTDSVEELTRFQRRRSIGYVMLSDERAQLVRQLDLLDPTQPPGRRHNGLPVPTLLFVSPQGQVLAKLGDADFRVRPAPESVLSTIDALR